MGHIQADGIDIQTDNNSWPWVCDWNEDGKKDLLVGQEGIGQPCNVYVYLNQGTNAAPVFGDSTPVLFNGSTLPYYRTIPVLQDLDLDGKKDIILGGWYSDVRFYTNVGTNANPVFTNYIYIVQPDSQNFSNGNPPRINFTDWDGDSDLDMITCDYYGSVFLRENVTPQSVAENTDETIGSMNLTVMPNPFSNSTRIRYSIEEANQSISGSAGRASECQKPELKIHDAAGQVVRNFSLPTTYCVLRTTVLWDGTDQANRPLANGVYFVSLEVGSEVQTQKLLLIR
jgi:hypothetical protein